MQSIETLILGLIALRRTILQSQLDIVGNKKRRAMPQMHIELRQKDVDSGEVEVAEMQIAVRYALQPSHQVTRLWIAADK